MQFPCRTSKNGRKYTAFGVAIIPDRNLQAFHYNVVAFGKQGHFAKPLLTLPSECVALSWAGLEDFISPRGRRGGGNVGIGFIDFQGLWEGRETALSFSSLSMNRHFHGLPRSA